ncbi:MAG TPA: DUF1697 domain-containing protein [Gemmatimonadales bacterium]|jgi:uncharacterized protein (DUF1697 family)|nr:DUF1697 domain-containing protein [Gemmatimonadales bacterium]
MANRQVALIRGINVGRAKRVAMADLRALVTELGYRDVSTLLNSGNVVFTVPGAGRGDPAARIERAMSDRLGVTARVLVLTAAEVAAIMAGNPLGRVAADPSRLLVTVLANPADRARLVPLTRRDWAPEALGLGGRVAYLWCPVGILKSPVAEAVGGVLGDRATARNWATMTKLHGLLGSEGEVSRRRSTSEPAGD